MPTNTESGIRRAMTYFAREERNANGNPVTPQNPTFIPYSSTVSSTELEPTINFEERSGIGNDVAHDKQRNQEQHELTVAYDLERFPVDADGNHQDAIADAVKRDIDNALWTTHSYLEVVQKSGLLASNTLHHKYFQEEGNQHPSGDPAPEAETGKDARFVGYGRGGYPSEPALSVDPGDSAVLTVELPYQFTKIRKFQIDQPASSTTLAIRSTAPEDTGITVEIENEDASTTEQVTTDPDDGTTLVETSSSLASIRAVRVDAPHEGTIEVYEDTSDTSTSAGQLLAIVRGQQFYGGIEADNGVPLIGDGEKQAAPSNPLHALGDELRFRGAAAAQSVQSTTFSATNNVESSNTQEGLAMEYAAGARDLTAESTVFGETETYDKLSTALQGAEGSLVLSTEEGDIVLPRAYISEGGSATRESEQAFMSTDVTFSALQPAGSQDPIEFQPSA